MLLVKENFGIILDLIVETYDSSLCNVEKQVFNEF